MTQIMLMALYRGEFMSNIIWGIVAAFLSIMFFMLGSAYGEINTEERWKKTVIERNLARYHPKTGKFEWIVEKTNESLESE